MFYFLRIFFLKNFFNILFGIFLVLINLLFGIFLTSFSNLFLIIFFDYGIKNIDFLNYIFPNIIIRFLFFVQIFFRWYEKITNHDITFLFLNEIRLFYFTKIFPFSLQLFDVFNRSDLLNIFLEQISVLDNFYIFLIIPFVNILIIFFLFVYFFSFFSILMSFVFIILFILVFFFFNFFLFKKCLFFLQKIDFVKNNYLYQLNNFIKSQSELIMYNFFKEKYIQLIFFEKIWQKYQIDFNRFYFFIQSIVYVVLGYIVLCFLFIIQERYVLFDSKIVIFFILMIFLIFDIVFSGFFLFYYFSFFIFSYKKINSIFNKINYVNFYKKSFISNKYVFLNIKNIYFKYPLNFSNFSISNVSCQIDIGDHIVMLGHSGSGKSTFLKLLVRSYDVCFGKIYINNLLIKNFSEENFRKMISVLPQYIHIFIGTLRDNLLVTNSFISDKKLIFILENVGLEYLLFSNGLDLWIGENGRQLSSGEKKRIGIARVIIHNAPFWILDEPTEFLDIDTEKKILQLIFSVGKNRTILVITHKIFCFKNFCKFFVMENGSLRIFESYRDLKNIYMKYMNYVDFN